jgi:hypothetical protein
MRKALPPIVPPISDVEHPKPMLGNVGELDMGEALDNGGDVATPASGGLAAASLTLEICQMEEVTMGPVAELSTESEDRVDSAGQL